MPSGIGTIEDRYARLNWEKSRLVNPITGTIPNNIRAKELAFAQSIASKNASSTGTIWNQRGPGNIGGRTRDFAFDVNNENVIVAGGVTGVFTAPPTLGKHGARPPRQSSCKA